MDYEIASIAPFASKLVLRMTAMTVRKKFRGIDSKTFLDTGKRCKDSWPDANYEIKNVFLPRSKLTKFRLCIVT